MNRVVMFEQSLPEDHMFEITREAHNQGTVIRAFVDGIEVFGGTLRDNVSVDEAVQALSSRLVSQMAVIGMLGQFSDFLAYCEDQPEFDPDHDYSND